MIAYFSAVIINFAPPSGFGQLGLLQFYAGLLTLFFTLASKQGTLKRTFGGGDDDDDVPSTPLTPLSTLDDDEARQVLAGMAVGGEQLGGLWQ